MFKRLVRWIDRLIDGDFTCFYCGHNRKRSRLIRINARDLGYRDHCNRCDMRNN